MDLKQLTSLNLKAYELKAKKQLGQNFLVSEKALNKIINAAEIKPNELILEIGPGTGNLTRLLAEKTSNLVCLEKDTDMEELLAEYPVQYVDALEFDPVSLKGAYKLIANIPYYITSPLINHYLKDQFKKLAAGIAGNPPKLMVLLVQKEVAEKICDPKFNSFLSIGIKTFGKPSIAGLVKKGCFLPAPNVDSAILKIEVYPEPLVKCDLDKYFEICSMAFANPRKKLSNNLKKYIESIGYTTEMFDHRTGVNLNLRAEKLNPEDFEKMAF